jgi:hypothetical protein
VGHGEREDRGDEAAGEDECGETAHTSDSRVSRSRAVRFRSAMAYIMPPSVLRGFISRKVAPQRR